MMISKWQNVWKLLKIFSLMLFTTRHVLSVFYFAYSTFKMQLKSSLKRSKKLFSNEADETKDLDLQRAIRAFHWIGPAMLGAKLDRSRLEVSSLMDQGFYHEFLTDFE